MLDVNDVRVFPFQLINRARRVRTVLRDEQGKILLDSSRGLLKQNRRCAKEFCVLVYG